jgi:hypothetical protein
MNIGRPVSSAQMISPSRMASVTRRRFASARRERVEMLEVVAVARDEPRAVVERGGA